MASTGSEGFNSDIYIDQGGTRLVCVTTTTTDGIMLRNYANMFCQAHSRIIIATTITTGGIIVENFGTINVKAGGRINMFTSGQFLFNSTQLAAIEAQTTAVTSSLAGAVAQLNTLSGAVNDIKTVMVNLGLIAST